MKNIVLWGFWPLVNPGLTRGILVILVEKWTLSAPMSERVAPCHYICSCDPMERKWYFWVFQGLARKWRANKIRYQQILSRKSRSIVSKKKKEILKRIRSILCKEKKLILFVKIICCWTWKKKKKLSKEDPHSWVKFIMHASHI